MGDYRCNHCRYYFPLDDMKVVTPKRTGCCVRCYLRETETLVVMSDTLRREVEQILLHA